MTTLANVALGILIANCFAELPDWLVWAGTAIIVWDVVDTIMSAVDRRKENKKIEKRDDADIS
ncbi:hypothetical protein PP301_gp116 [Gordonia phage GMA2]|uniref:Uncharacterized protein n=1 Tax=Gordonia phage GMA2 TaxID=1647283 RepID=A0A0K0N7G7_9CAUD|nr:hypothetical protein PP301_gp116 [Gordonia phage GMA2]AKJ72606.1 hypothetical protein GMA2_68 [Gordonia phage GMA2]